MGADLKKRQKTSRGWNLSTTFTRSLPTTMSKRSPPPDERKGGRYDSRAQGRTRDHDGDRRYRHPRDDYYDRHDGPSRKDHSRSRPRDDGYSRPRDRRYDSGYRNNDGRQRDSGWGSRIRSSNVREQPVPRERSAGSVDRRRSRSPPRKRKRGASRDAPNGNELIRRSYRNSGDQDDEGRVNKRDRSEDARSDRRRALSAPRYA
jgi:hypothetical protein